MRPSNINIYSQGNWRPLAGGTRREHMSLSEIFYGKGILMSCQLHVIENMENIQAKSLLINMLNYLTDKDRDPFDSKVAIKGNVDPADMASLTGCAVSSLEGALAENQDLMIALDGAKVEEIKEWASRGGRVLVLSPSLSEKLGNLKIVQDDQKKFYATKIEDHPVLSGVASANFLFNEVPVVKAYFSALPGEAKVIMQGFSLNDRRNRGIPTDLRSIEEAGPVMVSLPFDKGEIILSTIELEKNMDVPAREFLSLLLTNSGVEIPVAEVMPEEIAIKKTVPLIIDGRLTDWLEDMEDRLVTKYIHAQPVYLTSESIVEGPPEFDLNLSAIDYFMWDDEALYISGVVFTEEKTLESGVQFGREKEYDMDIWFNEDKISFFYKKGKGELLINGKEEIGVSIGTGQIESGNMTDATLLQFSFIQKSGKIAVLDNLTGATFELRIPWGVLKSKSLDKSSRALIILASKGSRLQVPLVAGKESKENWMKMIIR